MGRHWTLTHNEAHGRMANKQPVHAGTHQGSGGSSTMDAVASAYRVACSSYVPSESAKGPACE